MADGEFDEGEVLEVDDDATTVGVCRVLQHLGVFVSAAVEHTVR